MKKIFSVFLVALSVFLFSSCNRSLPEVKDCDIIHEPEFGGVYIKKTIEEFNNKEFETVIKKKEFIIQLNDDLNKYKLKKSKKNKKPKNDYPPFNNECLLKDIDCKRFNLLFENSEVILNKKINKDKSDTSCIFF